MAPLAVLLVAVSKGGFAGGTAIIGVPAMALAIDPVAAAGIMLPLLVFMDVIALRAYWGQWHHLNARILIGGALFGIAAGWASFRFFEPDGVRLLLGIITLVFSLNYWLRRRAVMAKEPQDPSIVKGGFWGAVAGFTTFIAHA
ncbi:MAG: sulfite exporter TauE/SafE family protein, partial [Alphaproteobacteria bacterium]|nr:sulfite exporter TauE/SafE family protein [Alphaproteobacteria bacterium]